MLNFLFGFFLCAHKHTFRGRDEKGRSGLQCSDCPKFFPFPVELTQSTGVFRRIEKRVALEERLKNYDVEFDRIAPYL